MITTANITMQFGAKPLFENISAKFGNGNRYGLIGANGCGKSTFMKILGGELEPSSGNFSIDANEYDPRPIFMAHDVKGLSIKDVLVGKNCNKEKLIVMKEVEDHTLEIY